MAFLKNKVTLRGLSLQRVYLKISRLEYIPEKKQITYTISAYPSKTYSKDENCICEYFYGVHDIKIGQGSTDILAQIYEELKYRTTAESELELDSEYSIQILEATGAFNTAISAIPKDADNATRARLESEAQEILTKVENHRRRYARIRELFSDVSDC